MMPVYLAIRKMQAGRLYKLAAKLRTSRRVLSKEKTPVFYLTPCEILRKQIGITISYCMGFVNEMKNLSVSLKYLDFTYKYN